MSREDHTSGEILSQTEYSVRWAVFALMWIFGMMTIVMGMTTQEAGRDWKYLSVYLTWTLATAVFVFLDLKPTKTFVIHKLLYLASIGTVFWFVCAVLKINPDTIPVYIPMCTNLGIFLGIGFDHVWSSSKAKVRRMIPIIQASIAHGWSAEGGNEEELPLHLTPGSDPGNLSPLPHNREDGSAVEQQS